MKGCEGMWDNYKLVKGFNSKDKIFNFSLSRYDCYRIDTGKCSIDCEKSSSIPYSDDALGYCQRLLQSLIDKGVTNQYSPVRIIKNSCGHYSIIDGQHRLCSAAHGGICIDVYIQESEYECYTCGKCKTDFVYRCKSLCGKNQDFLLRL